MKIVILLSLFLLVCVSNAGMYTEYKEKVRLDAEKELESFVYVKDKFGICYAMAKIGWNSQVTTTVPCEKVNL